MSEVITREERGSSSTEYEIEGASLEDVTAAIERIKSTYHPAGYGTRFGAPVEATSGRWISTGSRSNNCD